MPTRDWRIGECPHSVLANPPLASAVEWNVRNREERGGDIAVQNAIERSTAAQDALMDQVRAGVQDTGPHDEPVLRGASATEEPSLPTPPATTAAAPAPRPAPRTQQAAAQPRQRNTHRIPSTVDPRDMVQFDGSDDELQISSSDDGNDQEYVQSDGDDDLLQVGRSQPLGGRSTRRRQGDDAGATAERPHRRQPRRAAQRNEIDFREDQDEDEYDSEDNMDAAGVASEESESEPELSDSDAEAAGASNRDSRRSQRPQRNTSQRRNGRTGPPARRSNRTRQPNTALLEDSDDQIYMDVSEDEDRGRRRGRGRVVSSEGEGEEDAADHGKEAAASPSQSARPEQNYAWLQECIPSLANYVPQAGDHVVYITSLHEEYIKKNLLQTPSVSGPVQLPNASFRVCEPCEVEDLQYFVEEASQMTVLRATLRLLEGTGSRHTSNSKNKFQIEIPPPLVGEFSEFLVELARFRQQAMNVMKQGARIKALMVSNEGRPEWYYGNIANDKLGGVALDESELYTAEVIERYTVSWEGDDDDASTDDYSPWEVYGADADEDGLGSQLLGSSPAVLAGCKKLGQKCHSITVQLQRNPCPLAQLPRMNFQPFTSSNNRHDKKMYNLYVPLPLAVGTIMSRAEGRWYRTLPQMRTDIDLISTNAECLYQEGHPTRVKAKEITTSLHAALDSGDSDDGNESAEELANVLAAGTSGVGTSRAALADVSEGPSTRHSRPRRVMSDWEEEDEQPEPPSRQTRSRAARMLSPEPESPSAYDRRSRGARKRRINSAGGWGVLLSEERSQEPVDRPRRTKQRVTYAS